MAFLSWDETCLWHWLYVPSASSSVVSAPGSSSSFSTLTILQKFYSQESFSSCRWLSLQNLQLHILMHSHILNFFLPMLSFNKLKPFRWCVLSQQKPLSNPQKSRFTFQVYCSSTPPPDQLVYAMQWVQWCQQGEKSGELLMRSRLFLASGPCPFLQLGFEQKQCCATS